MCLEMELVRWHDEELELELQRNANCISRGRLCANMKDSNWRDREIYLVGVRQHEELELESQRNGKCLSSWNW